MSQAIEPGTPFPSDSDPVTHYIFHNYLHLLTIAEKLAYKSIHAEVKAQHSGPALAGMLRRTWVSSDPNVQELLADGPHAFYVAVRDRVLAEHANEIYFNRCPKCESLARTPKACLCPACNHTWYERRKERSAQLMAASTSAMTAAACIGI